MRAYERFLNYIQYDTASDADSPTCPSTEKQLALGRALAGEMKAMGIADARIDEYGYVYGSIPANTEGLPCPNIATGGMNFHGRFECVAVEDMDKMTDMLVQLVTEE